MTVVYAIKDGVVIWADGKMVHKQGRVPLHAPIVIKQSYAKNWYIIERPKDLYIGDDSNPEPDPNYPKYWVRRESCLSVLLVPKPGPDPEPMPGPVPGGEITDTEAVDALFTFLRWLRQ